MTVLTDECIGVALAHEGIEPPDDAVERIAGHLRAWLKGSPLLDEEPAGVPCGCEACRNRKERMLFALRSWWGAFQRPRFEAGHPYGDMDALDRWVSYILRIYDESAHYGETRMRLSEPLHPPRDVLGDLLQKIQAGELEARGRIPPRSFGKREILELIEQLRNTQSG